MRKILMIGLVLIMASCKSKKLTTDSSQRFVIENLAGVNSSEDLKRIYPNSNLEEGTDLFEEGTVERAYTLLFPGGANEALITWEDDSRTRIHSVRVGNPGEWKSNTGIRIGTPYAELIELNGPVKVYGFGWDYSGAVDWNHGKLADTNIRVFLAPKDTPPTKYYGDNVIEATSEELDSLNLSVQGILFQKSGI